MPATPPPYDSDNLRGVGAYPPREEAIHAVGAALADPPREEAIHAVGAALADLLDDLEARFPGTADEAATRLGAALVGKGGKAGAAFVPRDRPKAHWLNTRAAAAYTGDDPTTLRKAAEAGELVGSQKTPGRSPWKFTKADLDQWVTGR